MTTPKPKATLAAGHTTAEQRRLVFVEHYLNNGENASQAALAAGFSAKTAPQQGHRLLKNVQVQQLIEQRRTKVLADAGLTTELVIRSLVQALTFDPRRLYREDGTLKAVTELDDDTAMALQGIEVTEEFTGRGKDRGVTGFTRKLKWHDKTSVREQALKHLGMYRKDNEQVTPTVKVVTVPAKEARS